MTDDGKEQGGAQGQSHGRRAGRPLWPAAGISAVEAVRRTRRMTYRLTGSPARTITGEKMMISGHRAREMTAWVTGPGRLIWPG